MSKATQDNEASFSSSFMGGMSDSMLHALTSSRKVLISSMKMLSQPQDLVERDLKAIVADIAPTISLLSKELCDLSVVYPQLRNFLNGRGCNLQQHPSRRIMMTLDSNLSDETEDKAAVMAIVKDIKADGRKPTVPTTHQQDNTSISNVTPTSQESPAPLSSGRVAHNHCGVRRLKTSEISRKHN